MMKLLIIAIYNDTPTPLFGVEQILSAFDPTLCPRKQPYLNKGQKQLISALSLKYKLLRRFCFPSAEYFDKCACTVIRLRVYVCVC